MKIEILDKKDINDSYEKQVRELFTQLSSRRQESLIDLFNNNHELYIVVCKENEKILGIALMACYKVISGYKGWIEDVVVDKNHRNQGVGRKLIEKLIETAEKINLREILLFTEDQKHAAINLYKNKGFELKESRIYVKNIIK
ncbi:GNAT family N-acetyltransferase [Abyssalbus ytuae]|uniref:GNAT family N-acetyltransferase n=1 Tax=Abyssalbus ytuae TaxID=2926907 RepID=A0A9E6ZY90_9FLAO|nr:GNAT family N-acetyltransferase [Abyssalbus ytuae]UOB17407.1 GNAT family N-acetyltransferase [Abyssalbus ytuae]